MWSKVLQVQMHVQVVNSVLMFMLYIYIDGSCIQVG